MKNKHNTPKSKEKKSDKKVNKIVKKATEKTSQVQVVKEHLVKHKRIKSWQAWEMYGVTRLAARIYELREHGWIINTKELPFINRFGNKGTYAVYTFISQPKKTEKKK